MISTASQIARDAGKLMLDNLGRAQEVMYADNHDIKLQMDIDCQRLIESRLREAFPQHSIIGEEESYGPSDTEYRWIVDPIDGTVNYTYGIPHFCVSMGLQRRSQDGVLEGALGGYASVLGVIYDPTRDEIFTAEQGRGAFLNGKPIRVSQRAKMQEAILSVGFSKTEQTVQSGLRRFEILVKRARKIRNMGSAALDMAYVAAGRMEAYLETRVRLWDIAAGLVLVKEAGGSIQLRAIDHLPHTFEILVSNGKLEPELEPLLQVK